MSSVRSRTVDIDGQVFVADFGGSGPPFVLVHGLGGSHVNWMRLGPLLAERGSVTAIDLAGFGRTPPAGRSTGILANADLLARYVEQEIGGPAILVGNSLGGLVSIAAAASRPDLVKRLVLVDPAIPPAPGTPPERQVVMAFTAYLVPGIGEAFVRRRLMRLGPERLVRESFDLVCTDASRVPEEVIQAHVEMAKFRTRLPWADASMLRAARSMLGIILRRRRFQQLIRRVEAPTLLIHGENDRLVRHAAAKVVATVRPDWTFHTIPDAGHTPHLEAPEEVAAAIRGWLDGLGRLASDVGLAASRAADPS